MTSTKKKIDRSGKLHEGHYLRFITPVFGEEKQTPARRLVLNALFSFCYKGGVSEFTLREMSERYGVSVSSCFRGVKKALGGIFERADKLSHYRLKEQRSDDEKFHYFLVEDWLYFARFDDRPLTYTEVEVLSYLRYLESSKKKTTQAWIASTLKISQGAVSEIIRRFIGAGILKTDADGAFRRAPNDRCPVLYPVNEELLKRKRGEVVRREKACLRAAKGDPAKARELFYALRREQAERRSRIAREELGDEFAALEKELRALDVPAARAELNGRKDELRALTERQNEIRAAMRSKLAALGYTERDLDPFFCPHCEDTGFDRHTGRPCGCYNGPPRRRA